MKNAVRILGIDRSLLSAENNEVFTQLEARLQEVAQRANASFDLQIRGNDICNLTYRSREIILSWVGATIIDAYIVADALFARYAERKHIGELNSNEQDLLSKADERMSDADYKFEISVLANMTAFELDTQIDGVLQRMSRLHKELDLRSYEKFQQQRSAASVQFKKYRDMVNSVSAKLGKRVTLDYSAQYIVVDK